MFGCKHKWEVLSETTTKSRIEQAVGLGMEMNVRGSDSFSKKLIQIVTCSKCGKLKRFVERI